METIKNYLFCQGLYTVYRIQLNNILFFIFIEFILKIFNLKLSLFYIFSLMYKCVYVVSIKFLLFMKYFTIS